jgi:hypothetical protein
LTENRLYELSGGCIIEYLAKIIIKQVTSAVTCGQYFLAQLGHFFTDNNGFTCPRLTDRGANTGRTAANNYSLIIFHRLIFLLTINTSNSSILFIIGSEFAEKA